MELTPSSCKAPTWWVVRGTARLAVVRRNDPATTPVAYRRCGQKLKRCLDGYLTAQANILLMKRPTITPLAVCAILLVAVGCDFDPLGDLFEPTVARIGGTWTLDAAGLQDPDVGEISCNASRYRLVIDQDGRNSAFTGTYGGGKLTCVRQGETILDRTATGMIVNGTVGKASLLSSASVSFDFDTRDAHQRGNLLYGDSKRMGGTATWRIDFGGDIGSVNLVGQWEAVR